MRSTDDGPKVHGIALKLGWRGTEGGRVDESAATTSHRGTLPASCEPAATIWACATRVTSRVNNGHTLRLSRKQATQERHASSKRTRIAGVHLPLITVNGQLVVQRQAAAVHLRN